MTARQDIKKGGNLIVTAFFIIKEVHEHHKRKTNLVGKEYPCRLKNERKN